MKKGGGKNKGNAFEREIANRLSERFKEYTGIEKAFRRAIDSGSFFGGTNAGRIQTHDLSHQTFGDILTPPAFRWTIECKCYKDPFTLNSILLQKNKTLDEWIAQAEQDAAHAGKQPLVVIKFNNCEVFVLAKDIDSNMKFIYKEYRAYLLDDFLSDPSPGYFLEKV